MDESIKPNPKEFMEYFPYACYRHGISINLVRVQDGLETSRSVERKKLWRSRTKLGMVTSGITTEKSLIKSGSTVQDDKTYDIRVTAKYVNSSLTSLMFQKCKQTIPWKVFRILNETAQFYAELCSITVTNELDSYSLHEISKLFTTINITDLCLDGTHNQSFKYASLLDNAKNLQVLSLARCNLGDNRMSEIINNMESPKPTHGTLYALNVSSNALTDESAKNFAQMLRTNRKLAYLNLNGNRISTEGAVLILKVLVKFQLTDEEVKNYRVGLTEYLRAKQELMNNFIQTYDGPRKSVTPRKKSLKPELEMNTDEVERLAADYAVKTLGPYNNTFHVPEVDQGKLYCIGNNVMTNLGLCYNNIDFQFLATLVNTLRYQISFMITMKQRGLTCVKVEGNPLPNTCPELKEIDDMLTKALNELTKHKKLVVVRAKK